MCYMSCFIVSPSPFSRFANMFLSLTKAIKQIKHGPQSAQKRRPTRIFKLTINGVWKNEPYMHVPRFCCTLCSYYCRLNYYYSNYFLSGTTGVIQGEVMPTPNASPKKSFGENGDKLATAMQGENLKE